MKQVSIFFLFIILAGFSVGTAGANSSVEDGKKLFNDPTLGASQNDKSCASCHPDGEGLEKAGSNPKLTQMINRCIVGALKGEKIDGRTSEMRALKLYIESLGK